MASTESASEKSDKASRRAEAAQRAGAGMQDRTDTTRAAIDRAGVGQKVRETLNTPAGAGVLADAAARLDPARTPPAETRPAKTQPEHAPPGHTPTIGTPKAASVAPAAVAAPAGLAATAEALAARAGLAAAGAVGVAAGAAALALVPTNTAPATSVEISPNLRASFPHDSPHGRIELRVEGRWRDTGIAASMTPEGIAADFDALGARVGPLDDIPPGAVIYDRRNALGLGSLDALGWRARQAIAVEHLPGRWQAHHLIPFEVVNTLSPGLQHAIAQVWGMDRPGNLIALPQDRATFEAILETLPMHNGPHPGYSGDVRALLAPLEVGYLTMSTEELKRAMDDISGVMRGRIHLIEYHDTVR